MARRQGRDLYARTLLAGDGAAERYVDLAVEFTAESTGEHLLSLGGQWDRLHGRWTDTPAEQVLEVRVHDGQLEAARFMADWFRAYLSGEPTEIYSSLFLGGSRAGKTHLGVHFTIAFAVAVPMARVWAVQEAEIERADELETELDQVIPDSWATKRGPNYDFAHGARIRIRSGKYPQKLKRGKISISINFD